MKAHIPQHVALACRSCRPGMPLVLPGLLGRAHGRAWLWLQGDKGAHLGVAGAVSVAEGPPSGSGGEARPRGCCSALLPDVAAASFLTGAWAALPALGMGV